jgi:hypothetical protein
MTIAEAATMAARTVAQVATRSNANTFRYLSQLPHLAMGWAGFFGWPMKSPRPVVNGNAASG